MEPVEITIRMTVQDFDQICTNGGEWGAWASEPDQIERWNHTSKKYDVPPSFAWKYYYVLDNSWTDVMMARSFLEAHGAEYEIVYAEGNGNLLATGYHDGQYFILTDFPARGFVGLTD